MFLKEKRDGSIKGRTCADGRKQRENSNKEDATSPTVALESVMITSVIDAYERRDVAVADIPGAFLTADMDEVVRMCLRGRLAELMVKAAPNIYSKYVTIEKGVTVLYVTLQKALYGTLKAALLFYKRLVKDLESYGFELNPYDPCVANMTINGSQFTIVWHVDDLKMSHKDQDVVTDVINWLKGIYGEHMRISRGKKHDYLGMDLDFSHDGEVWVTMVNYVQQIIDDFPEEIIQSPYSPAALHLFTVRDDAEKLDKKEREAFHHAVAQLLFLSARARKDLQPATAFLTGRVKCADRDDWGKLKRILGYAKATLYLPLILRADSLSIVKWHVDASFAVHDDCKGHTGGTMTLGKGSVISITRKQKLNARSSTESELIGADDVMPQVLWTKYFIEEQGYNVEKNIVNQDNMSGIKLEENGKKSSTKRTKHIRVRYFFIKDRIEKGDIDCEVLSHQRDGGGPLHQTTAGDPFSEVPRRDPGDPGRRHRLQLATGRPSRRAPQECVEEK